MRPRRLMPLARAARQPPPRALFNRQRSHRQRSRQQRSHRQRSHRQHSRPQVLRRSSWCCAIAWWSSRASWLTRACAMAQSRELAARLALWPASLAGARKPRLSPRPAHSRPLRVARPRSHPHRHRPHRPRPAIPTVPTRTARSGSTVASFASVTTCLAEWSARHRRPTACPRPRSATRKMARPQRPTPLARAARQPLPRALATPRSHPQRAQ